MITLFVILHGIIATFLILIVLIQSGKGAMQGASMGAGQQIFGGSGGRTFFTRATGILAGLFMLNCIWISWLEEHYRPVSRVQQKLQQSAPPPVAGQTMVPLQGLGSPVAGGTAGALPVLSTAVSAAPSSAPGSKKASGPASPK